MSEDTAAYTIGYAPSYDQYLHGPDVMKKIGKREGYEGGWVWRTEKEAAEFLSTDFPGRSSEFAVYKLHLPDSWDEDTYELKASDGVRRLRHDARIVGRVDPCGS